MGPCADVRSQGNVVDLSDAHLPQPLEDSVAVDGPDPERGGGEHGYGHTAPQVVDESMGVVLVGPYVVSAGSYARAAGYTTVVVDFYLNLFILFVGDAGPFHGANTHASVATDTCGLIVGD